jgi:molybdopterin converting factor small subunit
MNYYETFKPEADKKISALAETVKTLSAQLPKIRKRLADEQDNAKSLNSRIEKLKQLSAESLTGDQNDYEKFKVSLKKLTADLESSKETCRLLADEVLPKKTNELNTATTNLKIALNAFLLKSRSIADKKINELLIACVNERQDFLDAFKKIFSDYGLSLVVSDESFCPSIWTGAEIRDMRLKLGMDASIPPVESVTQPQDELNSEKGSQIPPEALSLEIEDKL